VQRRLTQPIATAPAPGLLSVDDVARAIRRHPEVVRRQARAGRLPAEKIGRGWFFRAERLVEAGHEQFRPLVVAPDASDRAHAASERLVLALSQAGAEALQMLDTESIFQAVGRRLAEVGLSSHFFLLTPDGQGLTVAYANVGEAAEQLRQLTGPRPPDYVIPLDQVPVLKRACQTRQAQYLGDTNLLVERVTHLLGSDAERARKIGNLLHMRTAISAPLVARDRVLGAINVVGEDLRESHLPALTAFANQTAAAMETARLLAESRELQEATVLALTAAVSMREVVSARAVQHADLADHLAQHLRFDPEARRRVRYTAFLQDLGKLALPESILKKQRRLNAEERAVMMTHPVLAADLLKRFRPLAALAPLVRAHHEWFNGEGYPDRLKGDAIPIETRVVSVVNAFFNVTFDLPSRSVELLDEALEEVKGFRGIGLDPSIVNAFIEMLWTARDTQVDWYQRMERELSEPQPFSQGLNAPRRDSFTAADSRELQIIYRIAQETAAVLDLETLLKRIVSIIQEVMDYDLVLLLLPGEDPDELQVGAHAGRGEIGSMRIPAGTGITGWVFQHRAPQIVPDVRADSRYIMLDPQVRSKLAFPLVSQGRVIGVLDAESQEVDAFGEADLALMAAVGSQLASCLEVAQLHDRLKREATHDALTRLVNRRLLLERVEQQIESAGRSQGTFSIVFLDVDQLKHVNDTYGHLAGDALLREVANALTDAVRGEDLVARYGGDEFVVLLPSTPAPAAIVVAQRIREGIARHRVMIGQRLIAIPGVSLGIATYPDHGQTTAELLAAADATLYAQKRRAG